MNAVFVANAWPSKIMDCLRRDNFYKKRDRFCCKGPHTRSNKFAQQRVVQKFVVQQEIVSIHDTVILRKLKSLGKCHNENMSKAACLAIILACATEEETYTGRGK
jgi:hypothetical protein